MTDFKTTVEEILTRPSNFSLHTQVVADQINRIQEAHEAAVREIIGEDDKFDGRESVSTHNYTAGRNGLRKQQRERLAKLRAEQRDRI